MELLKADPDILTPTTLNISSDNEETKNKIQSFVDAYNDIITFIGEQKDADWGNDSAFRSVKRRMQDLLVTPQAAGGSYSTLSQIGFETQRDGTVTLSSTKLTDALTEDYDSVVGLLAGLNDSGGIAAQFASYLDDITDSTNGIYASRKESTDRNIRRIDQRIDILELRMEQREKTLRAKFSAMENLVSGLNAQGSFLAQQLASLNKG
jgi:flagellar hook-associated protein 2